MLLNIIFLFAGSILGSLIVLLLKRNSNDNTKQSHTSNPKDIKINREKTNNILEEEIRELKSQFSKVSQEYQESIAKNKAYQEHIISLKEDISKNNQKDTLELKEAFSTIQQLQAREKELSILLNNHETKEHDLLNSLNIQEEENNILKLKIEQLVYESEQRSNENLLLLPKSILVVDDSAVIRTSMEKTLKKYNFHITLAKDGNDALNILSNNKNFDLIITDLEMPNLDGLGLIKNLNTEEALKNIPVLILTGHENITIETTSSQNLFGAFKKPWDEQQLINKINILIS